MELPFSAQNHTFKKEACRKLRIGKEKHLLSLLKVKPFMTSIRTNSLFCVLALACVCICNTLIALRNLNTVYHVFLPLSFSLHSRRVFRLRFVLFNRQTSCNHQRYQCEQKCGKKRYMERYNESESERWRQMRIGKIKTDLQPIPTSFFSSRSFTISFVV